MSQTLGCTKCKRPLPSDYLNLGEFFKCPYCSAEIEAEIFPAFFRLIQKGSSGEALVVESEASCFYHQQKKAAVVCRECGRYLCSLCDVEFEGQHLCPPCLESAQKKGTIKSLQHARTLHGRIALSLAIAPIIALPVFWIIVFTAPAACYWGIRHWNSPLGIMQKTKVELVIAIVISSLQLLGMIGLVLYLVVKNYG